MFSSVLKQVLGKRYQLMMILISEKSNSKKKRLCGWDDCLEYLEEPKKTDKRPTSSAERSGPDGTRVDLADLVSRDGSVWHCWSCLVIGGRLSRRSIRESKA